VAGGVRRLHFATASREGGRPALAIGLLRGVELLTWIKKDFGVGIATSSAVGAKRPRLDRIEGEGS
jgi:hypothetical protein